MAIRVSNRQVQLRVPQTTLIVTCRSSETFFARDADAGPSGTSADAADRSFVRVARGAVVLIEGRARRVDDSKNELGRMPIEDFRPADRKRRFRCSPRWRPADVPRYWGSASKARSELDWSAEIPWRRTLEDLYRDCLERIR